jgi:hypothetical protein
MRRASIALAVAGVVCWLASYSWMVGLEPPTSGLFPGRSAWWVAEVAAVPLGSAALVLGLLAARGSQGPARRRARMAAFAGGAAGGLSALSITLPA